MLDCFDFYIKLFFRVATWEIPLGQQISVSIWQCVLGGFTLGIIAMFVTRLLGIRVGMEKEKVNAGIRGYWKGKE